MHVRLLQGELLLQCDGNRILESNWVLSKQVSLDGSIRQAFHERDDLRRVVNGILHDTRYQVSCVLAIRVDVAFALLQLEEFRASAEFRLRGLKGRFELLLEFSISAEAIFVGESAAKCPDLRTSSQVGHGKDDLPCIVFDATCRHGCVEFDEPSQEGLVLGPLVSADVHLDWWGSLDLRSRIILLRSLRRLQRSDAFVGRLQLVFHPSCQRGLAVRRGERTDHSRSGLNALCVSHARECSIFMLTQIAKRIASHVGGLHGRHRHRDVRHLRQWTQVLPSVTGNTRRRLTRARRGRRARSERGV